MAFHTKEQHRWLQLKGLFKEIRNIASIDELQVKLRRIFEHAGHVVEDLEDYECYGKENNFWPFSGLGIYLNEFATQEERKEFFDQILPQIAILAENFVIYLNDRNISLERKGNDLEISYYAVAGLLACGFLCAFPFSRNGTFLRKHNFAEYFGKFHRQSDQVDRASKLRSVIQYFQRLSVHDNLWNTSNVVKFTRKDIHYDQLPDLETWLLNQSPLCPVKVDSKNCITDSCGDIMELNFVSHYLEGGFGIKEDYEQNDLSTHLYPELLVAEWILQDVRWNEAIIVKKDDWSDIHVAITGVGICPSLVHNLRRNICNELNRIWVGLSGYTSAKFNERVQTSEENLNNNNNNNKVSTAQSNASLLSRESTQNSEKMANEVLCTSTTIERNEICTDRISEAKTFVNDYSEFLSKSIVKHAIEKASRKLHLSNECNSDVHEADGQTLTLHSPPSCQRNERLVTAADGFKNCNNDFHCRPFKPVSHGESTCGDLLIKSLVSSINGAVSLTNDITTLVSDQRISVALHCGNGLRNELEIKKLGRHTSVSTSTDMDECNKFSHARPSMNSHALDINGDSPDDTEDVSNNAPEATQDPCSWMETMAFNLAHSITQSAVVFASKCLSPGIENISSNTISTDVCQINETPSPEKYNLPALNTDSSSSIVAVDHIDDIKCSTDVEIEVGSEDVRGLKTSLEAKDCNIAKAPGFSSFEADNSTKEFNKSGLPQSLHYRALDVFAERMSNRILSDVMGSQHFNGAEDEKRSLPLHDTSRHKLTEENVQLQMAIQWIVASAMGCPCLICYAKEETESRKIAWISDRAHRNGWLVSDIVECILEYYQTKLNNHTHNQPHLFDFLQSTINEPKC